MKNLFLIFINNFLGFMCIIVGIVLCLVITFSPIILMFLLDNPYYLLLLFVTVPMLLAFSESIDNNK